MADAPPTECAHCARRAVALKEFRLALGGMAWAMRCKLRAMEILAHLEQRSPQEQQGWRSVLESLALLDADIQDWLATPEGQAAREYYVPNPGGKEGNSS